MVHTVSMAAPSVDDCLVDCAVKILQEPDPWKKAEYTREVVRWWRTGAVQQDINSVVHGTAPDRPARADDKVRLVHPGQVPKLGKGGSLQSRIAITHSLAHIESWAIDLSWDIIARFGAHPDYRPWLPRAWFDDWVAVADDECRHFLELEGRLRAMGAHYGALPAHDGLWESATVTAGSLPARMAVEHCVHEARGLDVLPATIAKFVNGGDAETAALLEGTIYPEEVSHCAAGVRWLRHLHQVAHAQGKQGEQGKLGANKGNPALPEVYVNNQGQGQAPGIADAQPADAAVCSSGEEGQAATQAAGTSESGVLGQGVAGQGEEGPWPAWMEEARRHAQVQTWFHALTRAHFHGALKPPFNEHARTQAGFDPSWYLPLAEKGQQALAGKAQTRAEQADRAQQAQAEGGVGGGAHGISCGATD